MLPKARQRRRFPRIQNHGKRAPLDGRYHNKDKVMSPIADLDREHTSFLVFLPS